MRRGTEAPCLVPLGEELNYTGFRSTYAYDGETAEHIKRTHSAAGLADASLYSDCLFLDCDTADIAFFVRCLLDTYEFAYSEYNTGNRGAHFHVPVSPMAGPTVPFSQKLWVRDALAVEVDTSMFHSAGQFRLPNTIHGITNKPKALVSQKDGLTPKIPIIAPFREAPIAVADPEQIRAWLLRALTETAGPGGREPQIFKLSKCCFDLGYSVEEAEKVCLFWNAQYAQPPHDSRYVKHLVRNKYYAFAGTCNRSGDY